MQIANPIYDIIFKYLMENDEIAKDILSALLNEKIIQVALKPQETRGKSIRFPHVLFRIPGDEA